MSGSFVINFTPKNVELGEIFASIGVRELQPNASEAFAIFSEAHRYSMMSNNLLLIKSNLYIYSYV